jgi:PAS domain S-box-containing protein
MLGLYQYTPTIWPSALTIILLSVLGVYAGRRRNLPGAWCLIIYCLFGMLFLAAKVIEFLAVDFETKAIWFNLEYIWLMPGTTALTCFILEYVWPGRWITRRNVALLSIVPIVGVVILYSNNFHNLIFSAYGFSGDIVPLYGPVGWSFLVYNLGLRVVSVTALTWLIIRSPQHRWPAFLILLAETVVGIVLVFDPYIEESWFFYIPEKTIPVVACAIALFGFRIFDPISLAHRTVIEQLHAGMLVLDFEGRVISLNPAAERIFNTSSKKVKGQPVNKLLTDPKVQPVDSDELEIELNLWEGTGSRYYMLSNSKLNDFRGLNVGRLLLLNDVTEQKRVQGQVLEQERSLAMLREREKLARELHDNLGQVFAFVNTQGQTIHRLLNRGDTSTADEYVCRLVEVAREADLDIRESILGLRATISDEGLLPTLTKYLAKYEKNYGIQTQLEGSDKFLGGSFEPLVEVQLLRILQEALTNVRKHAKASRVRIGFNVEDEWACVTVCDNGKGFNPEAYAAVPGGHVGLRVMRERAEEVGGSLSLQSRAGKGTELVVRVPAKGNNHA